MSEFHISVLLQEAIDYLNVQPGKKYIDATLGGGGHSLAIVQRGGKVLAFDIDEDALEYVQEKLKSQNSKLKIKEQLKLVRGNFKDIESIAQAEHFSNVDGILFDLGVSSHQLDTAERGFSFQHDAALDMRMDKNLAVTAADLINGLGKDELYELFIKFGEESYAKAIVRHILSQRERQPIRTTGELARIIVSVVPKRFGQIHPATKIFQALRIIVNDELNNLKAALPQALGLLAPKGRIAIITFHSLEDRIVKQMFNAFEQENKGIILTKKPITVGENEVENNRRSRSAKLRVFEKI